MMTIAGIVGHNPVGVCSQYATKHFWGYRSTLADGWGRPQGLDRVSKQHDWVVGVRLVLFSRRGSTYQVSSSCDLIKSDLIDKIL